MADKGPSSPAWSGGARVDTQRESPTLSELPEVPSQQPPGYPTCSRFQGGPIPLKGQLVTTEKARGLSRCRKRLSKQPALQERTGVDGQEEVGRRP